MRELINHTVTIDYVHNYKIDEIKEGGMSYVLLLSKVNNQNENPLTKALYKNRVLQDRYSLLYRDYLAAKIVKETTLLPDFERECSIWLGFSEKGIVPLLKVANIKESILALMPRYTCSLRKIILDNLHKPSEILRLLYVSVESLHNIYKKSGIIHQDIKPENFLIMQEGKDISIFLSDWGIANIQAKLIPQDVKELSEIAISTMGGIGTMPYMAPERFKSYISNVRA
nr:hypothetical protein [FCB group bacterium]